MKTISVKQLLIIFVPAIAILAAIAGIIVLYQLPASWLTRDVSATAGLHPLTGLLSNMGILLWCITGSICAFSAILLAKLQFLSTRHRAHFFFLFYSAILSTYLLFDDLFLFHEYLAVRYLGLDENIIYLFLGSAVAAYLIYFRRIILQTNAIIFLLALVFLALSVVIDTIIRPFFSTLGHWEFFIEDGAKWLGIVFWCSYYIDTSYQLIAERLAMPGRHPDEARQ